MSNKKCTLYHHHDHHHHVHEGLGVFHVPWSSRWSWSLHLFLGCPMFLRPFGLYCSPCFDIPFMSIFSTCCNWARSAKGAHPYRKACRSRSIKVAALPLDLPYDGPVTYPRDIKTLVKSSKGRSGPTLIVYTINQLNTWICSDFYSHWHKVSSNANEISFFFFHCDTVLVTLWFDDTL